MYIQVIDGVARMMKTTEMHPEISLMYKTNV